MNKSKNRFDFSFSRLKQKFQKKNSQPSIPETFHRVVTEYPNRTAVKSLKHHLTYLQLDRRSNKLAHILLSHSLTPGASVALLMEHDAPMTAAIMGILKAGGAYVPLDPGYPRNLLKHMLANSQARLLVTDAANSAFAVQLAGDNVEIININKIDPKTPFNEPEITIPPSSLAYILYTSGSKGTPKGVRHSHRNIQRLVKSHAGGIRLIPQDRVLSVSSCSFSMSVIDIFSTLLTGAGLFLFDIPQNGIPACIKWMRQEKITLSQFTVTLFSHLIDSLTGNEDFSSVRLIKLGGEPVYRSHFEQFKKHFPPGSLLLNGYGMSEILAATQYFIAGSGSVENSLVPVGHPTHGLEVVLLGEDGKPLPPGETGEIAIKSEFLFLGYQGQPDLTEKTLLRVRKNKKMRIFRTGDTGYRAPDGCITHLGRKGLEVKIKGARVDISEIEDALRSHDLIKETLVRVIKTGPQQQLEAMFVADGDTSPPSAELVEFLRERIPRHMIPACFKQFPALPRTATGKLDRSFTGTVYYTVPKWELYPDFPGLSHSTAIKKHTWLALVESGGIGTGIVQRLRHSGEHVITIEPGDVFQKQSGHHFIVRPGNEEDYTRLIQEVDTQDRNSLKILHLWSLRVNDLNREGASLHHLPQILDVGFYSLVFLVKSLSLDPGIEKIHLEVVTGPLFNITGREKLQPGSAVVLGPCGVIPLEYPNISCRCVDIDVHGENSPGVEKMTDQLILGMQNPSPQPLMAYRDGNWYSRQLTPLEPQEIPRTSTPLKMGGVYLITGGLGGIGLTLARHLAQKAKAKLILLGRSQFLSRDYWDEWLADHDETDKTSTKIRKLLEIEKAGGEILLVHADLVDMEPVRAALSRARKRFGRINGVIHSAGMAGESSIALKTRVAAQKILDPKIAGTLLLDSLLETASLDFFILCSSVTALSGRAGLVDYAAANAFMDVFARAWASGNPSKPRTVSINWDTWQQVGMAVDFAAHARITRWEKERLDRGLLNRDGIAAFDFVLDSSEPQVIVSKRLVNAGEGGDMPLNGRGLYLPVSDNKRKPYKAPRDAIDMMLLNTWEKWLKTGVIGITDNFFNMGGDSLKAAGILSEINTRCQINLNMEAFFQAPTVKRFAALLKEDNWDSSWEYLVPICPSGTEPPFFCVHNLTGDVWSIAGLRPYMPPDRPLYGIQAAGVDGKREPLENVEEIAANYLSEITQLQPRGPYFLGGRCFGGLVAFEMAQQLVARGEEVKQLVILDGIHPMLRSDGPAGEFSQRPMPPLPSDKIFVAHKKAIHRYFSHPYPGKILMFSSKINFGWKYQSWHQFAGKGLGFHLIPCNHGDLLKEPYVVILAEHLKKAFQET